MQTHVKVLATLHIVFGCLGILAGLVCVVILGGLGLVGATAAHSEDGALAWPILGGIGGLVFVVLLVLSLPQIVAGWGLLRYRPWARILTIVLSVLHLINIPFGTALGIYGLWVLLRPETEVLFRPMAIPAAPSAY